MLLSREIRELIRVFTPGSFPLFLEGLEIDNIRGWAGQRVDFSFPIVAIVGENGTGKSTIIQAAASIYNAPVGDTTFYASGFFPDTAWDRLRNVRITGFVRQGANLSTVNVRKPTNRWRGNEDRKIRNVRYLDLKRILPIYSKTGYSRLAKGRWTEARSTAFSVDNLQRLTGIVGKRYVLAKQAVTNVDAAREIPVLRVNADEYSGFHQGTGESAIAELLSLAIPDRSLVLIDEIEAGLHPRAQRRLIRDLANYSRLHHVQFIITTHSPYILQELPDYARIQVMNSAGGKVVVPGISTYFALSQMDDVNHPELDIYVEDDAAKTLLQEIIAFADLGLMTRAEIIPFGAANVGRALGIMKDQGRFPRPTLVMLDGDQPVAPGCMILPGGDAPERIVFRDLDAIGFPDVATNIARDHGRLVTQAGHAMQLRDHHEWVGELANSMSIGKDEMWRAFCKCWVREILRPPADHAIVEAIRNSINGR